VSISDKSFCWSAESSEHVMNKEKNEMTKI